MLSTKWWPYCRSLNVDFMGISISRCHIGMPHPHYKDKMVSWPSYLYDGDPHTRKDHHYIEMGPGCLSSTKCSIQMAVFMLPNPVQSTVTPWILSIRRNAWYDHDMLHSCSITRTFSEHDMGMLTWNWKHLYHTECQNQRIQKKHDVDGLVQDCSNSSASEMGLQQSWNKPPMWGGWWLSTVIRKHFLHALYVLSTEFYMPQSW